MNHTQESSWLEEKKRKSMGSAVNSLIKEINKWSEELLTIVDFKLAVNQIGVVMEYQLSTIKIVLQQPI